MTKPEPPKPVGFICAGCGRAVYSLALAPLCMRCRIKGAPVKH